MIAPSSSQSGIAGCSSSSSTSSSPLSVASPPSSSRKEINPISLVAWLALFSGPILIIISSILDGNTYENIKTASMNSWIIAIYLGFIMQPITYGCFYYVLKNNPMYKVLPIVTMGIPLTGLLAAVFLLGEKPTVELFIGGIVILIGVVMIVFKTSKIK